MNTSNVPLGMRPVPLAEALRHMADRAVTTAPVIVEAYEHIVKVMKSKAANGERSCQLDLRGCPTLSPIQKIALLNRLRSEGIEIKSHSGDQRDPRDCGWTELKW